MSPWFHGPLGKPAAEQLLRANEGTAVSGKFLFRLNPKGGFVLSVIYKKAPTHHAVTRDSDGHELSINKIATGCTSLAEIAVYLREKRPKWPVPLTVGVPGPPHLLGSVNGGSSSGSATAESHYDEPTMAPPSGTNSSGIVCTGCGG